MSSARFRAGLVHLSVDSRPAWNQVIQSTLHSDAVEHRMTRLACAESARVPAIEVIVRAWEMGKGWKILHWPTDTLAFFELRAALGAEKA